MGGDDDGGAAGELLALREDRFDFDVQTVRFSKNYLVKDGQHIEKNPKTGSCDNLARSRSVIQAIESLTEVIRKAG